MAQDDRYNFKRLYHEKWERNPKCPGCVNPVLCCRGCHFSLWKTNLCESCKFESFRAGSWRRRCWKCDNCRITDTSFDKCFKCHVCTKCCKCSPENARQIIPPTGIFYKTKKNPDK